MRLTKKLLRFLNRVFDTEPSPFLALRLEYAGDGLSWVIQDGVFTATPDGEVVVPLEIALADYTLQSLADFISDQDGYTVAYIDGSPKKNLSALMLLDGSGDLAVTNGGHLYGFESLLYSYFEANAVELALAEQQIAAMPQQMNVNDASGYWLDVLGDYYGVLRSSVVVSSEVVPEPDWIYGPRIIQEVLRPRSNNIALEMAIKAATGGQEARVVDAPLYDDAIPRHDASISYDGENFHNSTAKLSYNLFDVEYQFDLEGTEDIGPFAARVTETINKFRAAGTHLRSLVLKGSNLSDAVGVAVDSFHTMQVSPELSDSVDEASELLSSLPVSMQPLVDTVEEDTEEDASLELSFSTTFDGFRSYDGSIYFASGGDAVTEAL
ncbi:hypothetical protein [Parvibaculum sp.]|uniref:hypothetical protein n=1 Tax=Parvibaculum sp. TaxID=2024848 RepID=UPI0027377199|nr:hypothetical protein [Parvibaculum sp.]MDP3327214.1 hypothetical protein [Parvibaculum sp.]